MSEPLSAALERVEAALGAMAAGDSDPYLACWYDNPDSTLFGAWVRSSGAARRWSARSGGSVAASPVAGRRPRTLLSTPAATSPTPWGFERGTFSVGGGSPAPMTIRVTHVYRRVRGAWRLVHRHADFPPSDQRLGSAT